MTEESSDPERQETLLLAIRCVSLGVPSKTVFSNVGLFTNLYVRATTSPSVKNEKRVIKISQSEPFPTGGRPNSMNYEQMYTSEVFEDTPDIAPSLVAMVKRNEGMDSKMRLSVYYTSNLTGGREVLLSSTTFTERELQRAVSSSGELVSTMSAEYCSGSKAYIRIVPHLPALLDHALLPVTTARSRSNPLTSYFVFYHEQDLLTPYLDAVEQTWEPRLAVELPCLFLGSVLAGLERSVQAWQRRHELERMRQGRFLSDSEALLFGWHVLEVKVRAARMLPSRERLNGMEREMRKTLMRTNSNSNPAPVIHYVSHYPFGAEYFVETANPLEASSSSESPSLARGPRRTSRKTSTLKLPSSLPSKAPVTKKVDELAPCSYVELSVEDLQQIFRTPLGRTNTEYFTPYPVFGSNMHSDKVKKASSSFSAADDTVQLLAEEDELTFCTFEQAQRDFVPRRWRVKEEEKEGEKRGESVDVEEGEEEYVFTPVTGRGGRFKRYVANKQSSSVRLDLYFEAPQGGGQKCVGSCLVPLSDVSEQKASWVPLALPSDEDRGGLDVGEMLVEIRVLSAKEDAGARGKSASTVAAEQMGEVFFYERYLDGSVEGEEAEGRDGKEEYLLPDYRKVIADCYEWLWGLGYGGQDPLVDALTPLPLPSSSSSSSALQPPPPAPSFSSALQPPPPAPSSSSRSVSDDPPSAGGAGAGGEGRALARSALPDSDDEEGEAGGEEGEGGGMDLSLLAQALSEGAEKPGGVKRRGSSVLSLPTLEWEADAEREGEREGGGAEGRSNAAEEGASSRPLSLAPHEVRALLEGKLRGQSVDLDPQRTVTMRTRTDFPYSLSWVGEQVAALQELGAEIRFLLSSLKKKAKERELFRPSPLKKERETQPLPLNLHYQLLGVRKHGGQGKGVEVVHGVTSGAMAAHCLGLKKGGLLSLETSISSAKLSLLHSRDKFKQSIINKVREGPLPISSDPLSPHGLLLSLGKKVLAFERDCIGGARRRLFCLSQALTIAVSALLLKLNLVVAEKIPQETASRWLESGLLVLFEGLLSVTGNEKSMLEDTVAAVTAVRAHHVSLLSTLHRREGKGELEVVGREVRLFLSPQAIAKLPPEYAQAIENGGALIKLVTLLFTQGIDIQQTMANTFGESGGGLRGGRGDLQHYVNNAAFDNLNLYVFHCLPVDAPPSPFPSQKTIHPLLSSLYDSLRQSKGAVKNVDMLSEVERLCIMLGGCRVTFCKSGKDRTGMAVTLEQSRQLGERFGCGLSSERLLKDATMLRLFGTRLKVCEKNIGKAVYSINLLQAQFLPALYRPPPQVCEDIMKKDNS